MIGVIILPSTQTVCEAMPRWLDAVQASLSLSVDSSEPFALAASTTTALEIAGGIGFTTVNVPVVLCADALRVGRFDRKSVSADRKRSRDAAIVAAGRPPAIDAEILLPSTVTVCEAMPRWLVAVQASFSASFDSSRPFFGAVGFRDNRIRNRRRNRLHHGERAGRARAEPFESVV